jgi:hypothetical protein
LVARLAKFAIDGNPTFTSTLPEANKSLPYKVLLIPVGFCVNDSVISLYKLILAKTTKSKIMRTLFISMILFLAIGYSYAQCDVDEVELRVEIATDNWGGETSWTITNLADSIILQGGQGGVYGNNSSYADSICVPADGCYFFEIWDTYGDGIYAPNGYELYVDEVFVASGANDIGSYAIETFSCPNQCGMILNALTDLQGHINGTMTLSAADLLLIKTTFEQFPACFAESESMILLGKSIIADYDEEVGALFTTPTTVNGFSKDPAATPGLELEQAMVALQQGIFDEVFTPEVYADYPQHINGWIYNSCNVFPGNVDPPVDSSVAHSMVIRANFADPAGSNPYFDINGSGTNHALRPTGLYLAPGSVATVTVPDSLVGQDYFVRVGSHEWDLGIRPIFKRLDRISKMFPIDANTIEVFNPFGGAISILVPYGADDGIVEVSVTNGVECPFFSLKSFYESPDFEMEFVKPGPWAVFETDNVMFTIPSHSVIPGQYDIAQALLDWDAALQGVNSIMAREIVPDKHNMYMIADITIRHNVYSIGYPMSNTPLTYTNVPGPTYFLDGPGPNDEVNFHESGHALAMSKFPGEVEAIVNFPYIMALNYGVGEELNEAVKYSFVPNTFNIDRTATHRMVSNTFGTERNISNTTMDEVRYQHRGYGHYFEIVDLLGWCPLRNFWKQEYIDAENGIDHGINNQDIDSRIIRLCVAAQADLRPLFYVFGILPQDAVAMQDTLSEIGIQPSPIIYERLQEYFDLIPEDNDAFVDYALTVYPNLYTDGPTAHPDYGVGWHYLKSLAYDEAEAQDITNTLQGIIDLYFPDGEPVDSEVVDVCCTLDTLEVSLVDEEVMISGGVEPYAISIDTIGNVQTVTVTDFDSCQATAEYILISSVEELKELNIKVFPNPTSGEVQIDLGGLQEQVSIATVDLYGRVVQSMATFNDPIISYQLPEATGVYLLMITLPNGRQSYVRVVKK